MAPAVRCEALFKTYPGKPPVEAVRGIDLEIGEGECFGVLGPNGAGKTTTIEIIGGLLTATKGRVEVLGQAWEQNDSAIRQRIGVSLQETQLSEKLTVEETLSLFRSFYDSGLDGTDAMARVSLEEKAKSWVKTLSGGQKQRLALACALVGDPDLLFLDEPTTGLDPRSRRQVWQIVSNFRQQQRTILLTTHYMEEAERLCDRVAIVDRGQVIALGTPAELIASLGGEHVIEFTLLGDEDHEPQVRAALADTPSVRELSRSGRDFCVSTTEPHVGVPPLMDRLRNRDLTFAGLSIRHASLDDVFVRLAGRHLDDDESQEVGDGDAR